MLPSMSVPVRKEVERETMGAKDPLHPSHMAPLVWYLQHCWLMTWAAYLPDRPENKLLQWAKMDLCLAMLHKTGEDHREMPAPHDLALSLLAAACARCGALRVDLARRLFAWMKVKQLGSHSRLGTLAPVAVAPAPPHTRSHPVCRNGLVLGLVAASRRWSKRTHAVGFGVQEASAEEQEKYEREKALEMAEEAAQRAADPQGPDETALARLRIWAKSQRTHKVNPAIALQGGKLVVSMPMEAAQILPANFGTPTPYLRETAMEEDDPQRFVSSGGRSHQSSPSQSPRMGLVMTRGESQGSGASGASGASPSLKRRASIVAAKSFKSDRESEKKQVEARTWVGKVRRVADYLAFPHHL
eukprot:symbB.v1.2.018269.t1/scaffold1446.1/size211836/12